MQRAEELVLLAGPQPLHGHDDTGGNQSEARGVTTTVTHQRITRWVAVALLLFAAVLLFMPVHAKYIEFFDFDVVGSRTASCGPPIVAIVHNHPGLGGGHALPMGCVTASGGRRSVGLVKTIPVLGVGTRFRWEL